MSRFLWFSVYKEMARSIWSAPYFSLLCVRYHGQELKAAVLTLQYTTRRSLRHSTTRRDGQGVDNGMSLVAHWLFRTLGTFMRKIANIVYCQVCESVQVTGLRPWTPYQGFCSWTPLGALPHNLVIHPPTTSGSAPDNMRCDMLLFFVQVAQLSKKDRAAGLVRFGQKWKNFLFMFNLTIATEP